MDGDGDSSWRPRRPYDWADRPDSETLFLHVYVPVLVGFVGGLMTGGVVLVASLWLLRPAAAAWLLFPAAARAVAEGLERRSDSDTAWGGAGTALVAGVALALIATAPSYLGLELSTVAVGAAAVGALQWLVGRLLGRRLAGATLAPAAASGEDRSAVDRLLALLVESPLGRRETVVQERPEVTCDECHRWHVPGVDRTTIEGVAGRPVDEHTETLCEHCHEATDGDAD